MTIEPRIYERSIYEARLDIAYGVRFQELNEILYRRIDTLFGFIGLFGGSAALSAALGQWQAGGIAAGGLVAVSAICERLIRPAERVAVHQQWRKKFNELQVSVESTAVTQLEAVDAGLRLLQGQAPSGVSALAPIAYNLTVLSAGRTDYVMPVSRWQHFVAWLA